MRLRRFLVAAAIALLPFWAQPLEAQSGTKIATDVTATGQTGAMQSGPRATQVTFTFCGTGFTGNVYVDAAATEAGLTQVYTSSPSGLNNCSVTYLSVPATRWYRVRWAASAGALNVWMLVSTTASSASYATMPAPPGCVATSVPIFLGSPVALGCDAGLTYDPATDTLTSGRVRVSAGSATDVAVGVTGTAGSGLYFSGTTPIISRANTPTAVFTTGLNFNFAHQIRWTTGIATLSTYSLILGREADGVLRIGDVGGALPTAQSLTTQPGAGTNISGQPFVIYPSLATGSGLSGPLVLSTGYTAGAGTTQHAPSARQYLGTRRSPLTAGAATPFASLTYGASTSIGAEFFVTIRAGDGTNQQAMSYRVAVNSVRDAAGNTQSTVGVIGTPPVAAGSGTLTATFSVTEGAGAVTLNANAVSSLSETFIDATFQVISNGSGVTVQQL